MDIRKWSVRKVRRRPRSCDNLKRSKHKLKTNTEEEKSQDKDASSTKESVEKVPEGGVLLFGSDLDKQPMEGAIEFSSDQESTGGEEDEQPLGNCYF